MENARENASEIALLRQRILEEYEASVSGLRGLCVVKGHEFIINRQECIAEYVTALIAIASDETVKDVFDQIGGA